MNFWPFKKKTKVELLDPRTLHFTQLDITERFGDDRALEVEDWIKTNPINEILTHDNGQNLPSTDASDHEIYRVALSLSEIRETFQVPDDGVYCPVCNIASIDSGKLGKERPRCARPLLAFGWN